MTSRHRHSCRERGKRKWKSGTEKRESIFDTCTSIPRLKTSEELLQTIQEKVTYAERLSEEHRKHKAEVDARKDEATKSLKVGASLSLRSVPSTGSEGFVYFWGISALGCWP